MTEQVKQGFEDKPVQSSSKEAEKPRKRRDRAAKLGRHRWNQELLKSVLTGIEDVKRELRWVRHKLDRLGEAEYSK